VDLLNVVNNRSIRTYGICPSRSTTRHITMLDLTFETHGPWILGGSRRDHPLLDNHNLRASTAEHAAVDGSVAKSDILRGRCLRNSCRSSVIVHVRTISHQWQFGDFHESSHRLRSGDSSFAREHTKMTRFEEFTHFLRLRRHFSSFSFCCGVSYLPAA